MPTFIHQLLGRDVVLSTRNLGDKDYGAMYCSLEYHYCRINGEAAHEGRHTIFMPDNVRLEDDVTLDRQYEEVLIHEFAHMIQFIDWRSSLFLHYDRWDAAVARDNNAYITEHAMASRTEDNAISFTAWVLYYRGLGLHKKAKAHIRNTIRWRLNYINNAHKWLTLRHRERRDTSYGSLGPDEGIYFKDWDRGGIGEPLH